jgi:hypothetical protein
MADVEKMFYQVKVTEPDQNYLRFLWWPKSDLTKEPVDYRMTVDLFFGASSPGCSNVVALKRTADDHEEEFGSDIADGTLRHRVSTENGGSTTVESRDSKTCHHSPTAWSITSVH